MMTICSLSGCKNQFSLFSALLQGVEIDKFRTYSKNCAKLVRIFFRAEK